MRALIVGWFSYRGMGASAGDLLSAKLVEEWLEDRRIPFDTAMAPPFHDGVSIEALDPKEYSHLLFVCGPLGNGWPITKLLQEFNHCRKIGINVSMLNDLDAWNPFDLLIERDSSRGAFPDLVFLSEACKVPCTGRILVHEQKEYKGRGRHAKVNEAIQSLLGSRDTAVVDIDTRLDVNATGLKSPNQITSLIALMDVVVTTRLHGAVLALLNGVPPLVIDPISGGAKVKLQMNAINWPVVFTPEEITREALEEAYDWCLTHSASHSAISCRKRARSLLKRRLSHSISSPTVFDSIFPGD
jgi:hypothetical protein